MQANIPISGRSLDRLLCPVLVGAILAVFWPVLWGSFLRYDDGLNIVGNPHLGLNWDSLRWMFTDMGYAPRYLPLGWLAYSIVKALFGLSPVSFHASNLFLHVVNTLLLYVILKRLLPRLVAGVDEKVASWQGAAAAGALWWAINPLRTESVAWAASLIYFVATLFFFLSILAYLRLLDPNLNKSQRARTVWLAAVFYFLSLFTYPIALGGLAVFVVLDFVVLRRLPLQPREWRTAAHGRVWLEKFLFLLPGLLVFLANVYARATHPNPNSGAPLSHFGLAARAMQALWVWAWYIWKPWLPFDLAPKYPDLVTDAPFTGIHLAAAAVVGAITIFLFLRRKLWPALLAAWLCYLAMLLPYAGITEHPHYTCDRYSYLVAVIWAIVVASGAILVWQNPRFRRPLGIAFMLWCGLMGWQAHRQTETWQNSYNLHTAMAESLGNHKERAEHDVVAGILLMAAHHTQEAMPRLRQATALDPNQAEAWGALGDALSDQNQLSQAILSYERALRLKPEMTSARQNLAIALASQGRNQEAIAHFTEVLRQEPTSALAHYNLACCLNQVGQKDQARLHIEEFRRLQGPNH